MVGGHDLVFDRWGFSAQKGNPANSLGSSAYFGFFASGFYLGNNADDRAIGGVGFRPDVVIVKGNTNQTAAVRTSTMSGDSGEADDRGHRADRERDPVAGRERVHDRHRREA